MMRRSQRYILALDQGTTSSRALIFDSAGELRGMAQREFPQHFPQPGWVEHDAEDIWQSQIEAARQVLKENHVNAGQIAAIGIANQRETTVLWERATGRPLAPAIVWQDRRTSEFCARLRAEGHEPRVQQKTGLLLDPYFSASKLKWLLDTLPDARARAQRGELAFGTIDSWLLWRLTDGACHMTDATNASRTSLFNLHHRAWDDELLALFDIPRAVLPKVRLSSEVLGQCAPHWLGSPIPIAALAGDQQAATFGQACLSPGMAKNTYGTGCFMLLNTGRQPMHSSHRLLTTLAWSLQGRTDYALEGSVFMGGAIIQWLRDGLGLIHHSSEIEAMAHSVPDHGGVYLVPAFAGLGAPHWQADARAALFGMSRGTQRGHIARAALEAIAYQTADVLTAMQKDAGASLSLHELRVDGGAAKNNLLMQFQADILGIPVVRPHIVETTALGVAYLAGLAVGLWDSPDDLTRRWMSGQRFEPRMSADHRHSLLAGWQAAVRQTIGFQATCHEARTRTAPPGP
jgi:glycerol kinase